MSLDDKLLGSGSPAPAENLETKTEGLLKSTLKKFSLWGWCKIGITTSASFLLGTAINAVSYLASYLSVYYIANKKRGKITKNGLQSEFHLANYMSIFMTHLYKALNKLNPFQRTVVGLGGTIPLFNVVYLGVKHLVYNYSPWKFAKRIFSRKKGSFLKEIYNEGVRPNFAQATKDTYKYMGLPLVATWNYVPLDYQLAANAVTRFGYKYALEKSDKKQNDFAYA